jgi:hypothetical protein
MALSELVNLERPVKGAKGADQKLAELILIKPFAVARRSGAVQESRHHRSPD